MLGFLITLFWLFYFALYFDWLAVPHKTPSSGALRFKGPRADIVPILGTTPSIATLLGKRSEGSELGAGWKRMILGSLVPTYYPLSLSIQTENVIMIKCQYFENVTDQVSIFRECDYDQVSIYRECDYDQVSIY